MRAPITIPIAAVRGMLSGVLRSQTVDWVADLMTEAGIASELLETAGARVTGEQYVALFRLLMDRLDDECMGLMSRPLRRGSFVLVARSAVQAPTVAVALRRITRGFDLLLGDLSCEAVVEGSLTGISLRPRPGVTQRHNFSHELLLRVCWRLLAWLHGGKLAPDHFDFWFERPDYADIYAPIFPGSLRFGQPCSVAWFSSRALAAPVRRDAAALQAFLAHSPANLVLPFVDERPTRARINALLRAGAARTTGWPDLQGAAQAVNMAVSTLQRRLAVEGTSFQDLKDQLRRDIAIVRLCTSAVTLTTLAAELGFSDSASFQRAFKTWTGSPPGAYRRSLAKGAASQA